MRAHVLSVIKSAAALASKLESMATESITSYAVMLVTVWYLLLQPAQP